MTVAHCTSCQSPSTAGRDTFLLVRSRLTAHGYRCAHFPSGPSCEHEWLLGALSLVLSFRISTLVRKIFGREGIHVK